MPLGQHVEKISLYLCAKHLGRVREGVKFFEIFVDVLYAWPPSAMTEGKVERQA